jgi:ArsR family metal-binding transcriptional regulator
MATKTKAEKMERISDVLDAHVRALLELAKQMKDLDLGLDDASNVVRKAVIEIDNVAAGLTASNVCGDCGEESGTSIGECDACDELHERIADEGLDGGCA